MSVREVLAAYFDERLRAADDGGGARLLVLAFRAGPFRFLCRTSALADGPLRAACAIDGAELVPHRYRRHLRRAPAVEPDTLYLRGGRLAIRGVARETTLHLPLTAFGARGPRAEAPWIGATTREPPAFVLDPDAAQLHFGRRARR